MLIVANVYIWYVLYKHRFSVIITVAVHFTGGDSTNARPIISLIGQKVCFLDHNPSFPHKFAVTSISLNKKYIKTHTCMQRPISRDTLK